MLMLGFAFSNRCLAEESFNKRLVDPDNLKTADSDLYQPKLYELESDALIQGKPGTPLPDRVYAVYLKEKKSWFFALTNQHGKFALPMELIRFKTVIPGKYLGAKNPYQRYQLNSKWKWVPTNLDEEYYLWVLSRPQAFKRIMFFPPPADGGGKN